MKNLSILLLSIIVLLGFGTGAHAWIVGTTGNAAADALLADFMLKYQNQKKLGRGFANASIYSAHTATQRSYQGYDLFAITIGTMAGVHVPSRDISYYKKIDEKLEKNGDIYGGVAWNPWAVQVGFKVVDNLYLAPKFGWLKYKYDIYDFDGMTTGFMLNYQLLGQKKAPAQVFVWRGFSIGTGYMWQRNKTNIDLEPKPISSAGITIDPSFIIKVKTESHVIPLELVTSLRLLWVVNIHVGGGIDFGWGYSAIRYKATGSWTDGVIGGPFALYGKVNGKGAKNFMPKLTAGAGLQFGPVIIDIPVTYYFVNGLSVGASVGVVW